VIAIAQGSTPFQSAHSECCEFSSDFLEMHRKMSAKSERKMLKSALLLLDNIDCAKVE